MVKAKKRRRRLGRLDADSEPVSTATVPAPRTDVIPFRPLDGCGEQVIFDDGKIKAAVIDRECDEAAELDRLERDIRKELCGRPIRFKLAHEDNGLAVSAIVPTYYSKQLLLRAVQRASAPTVVLDRICVPYPSCTRP